MIANRRPTSCEVSAAVGHHSPTVTRRYYDHLIRRSFSPTLRAGLGLRGGETDAEVIPLRRPEMGPETGPEAAYARSVLLEELDAALGELPEAQREVFIAHELEGRSFKELAAETGVSVNTLLSRKRYAVLYLRQRLQAIYEDFV